MVQHVHVGLLTDFGTRAGYVSSMKGVILSICDSCSIVDLSHEITPQNVMEAALFLENCCMYFPRGFIFLAVVDPGVGTSRRMLCLRTKARGQVFIAPDNGLLDLVMKAQGIDVLISLENKTYWRETTSHTFHGRDIMGPVAAHVAAGTNIADLGPAVDPCSAVKIVMPAASRVIDGGVITGAVLYVDQFGNVVTNVEQIQLDDASVRTEDVVEISFPSQANRVHAPIRALFKRTYADVDQGEFLCLLNSENRFEIAVNRGSAAAKLIISGGEHSLEIRNVKRHGSQ